ncbi:phage scaffolding protein [Streptomyces sp. NPDC054887]
MPENEETEQVEQEPTQSETAPEAEQGKTDPWADPEAARKEIEKLRKEAAKYRTSAKELEPLARKAKELEDAQKSEQERLAEQLSQAESRIKSVQARAVRSEVRALASAGFADPDDAHAFLDLDSFVDDQGEIDSDGINGALTELLKRKPHLAKPADNGPRRPAPDRSQGSSGNGNRTPSDPAQEFAGFMNRALQGR